MTSTSTAALRVFLIRHGETAWSLSGQHTGETDIPLTAKGEDEARTLIPRLSGIGFTHVLTSPRQRARHTCELASLKQAAIIEQNLAEWNYGEYEGRRTQDILKERGDWNIFDDGCPGGETPEQVAARADQLIVALRKLKGNVALFSHGHFSRVLATRWINLPITSGYHFLISTASISILGVDPNHPEVPVIALWNATN